MECLNCGNCKENRATYYCTAKQNFVINENYKPTEKSRTGWKKGTKNYESHRRRSKKEIEI